MVEPTGGTAPQRPGCWATGAPTCDFLDLRPAELRRTANLQLRQPTLPLEPQEIVANGQPELSRRR